MHIGEAVCVCTNCMSIKMCLIDIARSVLARRVSQVCVGCVLACLVGWADSCHDKVG